MTVRFRKQTHFEQVREVEGPLVRKYKKFVEGIELDNEMIEAMTKFSMAMNNDSEIDSAIEKAQAAGRASGDVVGLLGDLSIVPMVLLDRLQNENPYADEVDVVLRDHRVEQFTKAMPLLLSIAARVRDREAFSDSTEVVIMTRLFVNALQRAGNKAFVLSDDLAWALKETELRRFPSDDLRLPFKTVYVEIPEGYKVYNRDTKWHSVIGCYISESEVQDSDVRRWRLLVVGESKPGSVEWDDALFFYSVDLFPGMTVDECLKKCRESHREINGLARAGVPSELFDEVEDENGRLFRLLMNIVLYVTNPEADMILSDASAEYRALRERMLKAQGGKRERIKSRMREIGSKTRIVLGGRLVVDRHVEEAPEGIQDSQGGVSEGRHWKVRTLVRGHWRSQPYGPGRKDRKPIWIKPHWAGPEHAPVTKKFTEVR